MATVTKAQLRRMIGDRPNKYSAKRTYVAEIDRWFASSREATAAVELLRRQQAGEVRGLRFQPVLRIVINGMKVCDYIADFQYIVCATGEVVTEDCKGFATPVYKLKKRLVKAVLGIDVLETR